MGHESGNEVEPDLRKRPARKKGGGATSRLLKPREMGNLAETSDPRQGKNPGEQVPSQRLAALREAIAGAPPSKKNQGANQPGTKFPARAMGQ